LSSFCSFATITKQKQKESFTEVENGNTVKETRIMKEFFDSQK
jgi:hypothetical protein